MLFSFMVLVRPCLDEELWTGNTKLNFHIIALNLINFKKLIKNSIEVYKIIIEMS